MTRLRVERDEGSTIVDGIERIWGSVWVLTQPKHLLGHFLGVCGGGLDANVFGRALGGVQSRLSCCDFGFKPKIRSSYLLLSVIEKM